jgi:hypothetical protein
MLYGLCFVSFLTSPACIEDEGKQSSRESSQERVLSYFMSRKKTYQILFSINCQEVYRVNNIVFLHVSAFFFPLYEQGYIFPS